MDLLDQHFFLTSARDIDAICAPLKKHFGITSFVYQKNFSQGGEIRLSNQPEWLKHFYDQEYYKQSVFETHPDHYQSGFALWSELKHHSEVLDAAHEFHITHGVTLTVKVDDGVEFYFFGTTPDNHQVVSLYLNNMDLLERFIVYFKDKAKKLIEQASRHKIFIHKNYERNIAEQESAAIFHPGEMTREAFLEDTIIKSYVFDEHTILTKRELDCVQCLLQGKTLQQTAEMLFISPRTAETHLENVRQKLHCQNKSELIAKLLKHGFRAEGIQVLK